MADTERLRLEGDFNRDEGLRLDATFKGEGELESFYFHGEFGFPVRTEEGAELDDRVKEWIEKSVLPMHLLGKRLGIEVGISIRVKNLELEKIDLEPALV